MASRNYYQIVLRHEGLGKSRVIRGSDRGYVQSAASLQQRTWAEQYARKIEVDERRRLREEKQQELEDNLLEAAERTQEAQEALENVRGLLRAGLKRDLRVNWASMMQPPFSQAKPQPRPYLDFPPEPLAGDPVYNPPLKLWQRLAPVLKEIAQKSNCARFEADHAKWRERMSAIEATNQSFYEQNLREHEDWNRRATAYETAREAHNASVEQAHTAWQEMNPEAIIDHADLVLSRSEYPDCFPKEFELDYNASSKSIVVSYRLPSPEEIPRLEGVKFSRTKNTLVETELTKREFEQLYSNVVFQVALRTTHELFQSDAIRALDNVVFNGNVRALNPGTGHPEDRCILTVCARRLAFDAINLRSIEPRACFESLGGVAGAKMLDLRAVKPLASIDTSAGRFSSAENISDETAGGLDEWQELVRTISEPTDVRFIPLGTIAMLLGFPATEKLSLPLSKQIAGAVEARGYAIEPDSRHGGMSYRSVEEVALFLPIEATTTASYTGAAALLQLCVMIASADGHPTEKEMEVARDFISRSASQTPGERQRLYALELFLCRNPDAAKRSLSRLTKKLPSEQRQLVCEVLVCVAGADGIISSPEWAALDRACKALDLSTSVLDQILRKLGASFDEPTVQEAEPASAGEPLPVAVSSPATTPPTFKLDMSRVAAISHETAQVISLLSSVMSEEETKVEPKPVVQAAPQADQATVETPPWMSALDTKYRPMTIRVIRQCSWSRAEFQQLASEFKLMPLGAFDAINEWADEHLGEFLLEGEDPVAVNVSILPKAP